MNPLNAKSAAKCGYALPLALSTLLAISLLLASLAHLPGTVRSTVKRTCREVLRLGDSVGDYRIESIGRSDVLLKCGRRKLLLEPAER